ncbi:hypothetical protein GCM10010922_16220 [Microbacterium sorbitolivorans]|uniref:Uncharacterized protein n=1 Tax=Microbacterium sorbitolivorans TaxID=1867410 RepID=A0A367Y258_9MICO|nr:hypothetical protein DTO57_07375 [Microbacterium sorbitolivorans]GGF41481.1 hypothetical protein GCM10010922_16220 [Microbacterium sorbitolivorans]
MAAVRFRGKNSFVRLLSGLAAAVVLGGVMAAAPHALVEPAAAATSPDPDSSRPVYRFWSEGYGNSHFYTLDYDDAQNLHSTDGWWTYEGTDFRVWPLENGSCPEATTPVYRFWSPKFTSHFYTVSGSEADALRQGDPNWDAEGVRFCAASEPGPGLTAVYRFWSSAFNKHFYTANASEAERLRTSDPKWAYEGIEMYAPTSGAASPPVTGEAAPRMGCQAPDMSSAIAAHDAARIVRLFGGAGTFRDAVASGRASCVPLDDPALPWVLVNKQNPVSPIDYVPASLTGGLRTEVAGSYADMQRDAAGAGAGSIGLTSGYRSYSTQAGIHRYQVGRLGVEDGERLAARPGYSEHQLGLAADVVACGGGGCGSLYDFAGTSQERWVRENSWRYGWIVRYEQGQTATTGYNAEPWHLRYIGTELARAYHDGGYRTLESFLGAPSAPNY